MVGKIKKPPMLTRNMRVFVSRPIGIWLISGSPFNEPIVLEFGYFYDAHFPHKVDAAAAVKVAYHTQLAKALAVRLRMVLITVSGCTQFDTSLSSEPASEDVKAAYCPSFKPNLS